MIYIVGGENLVEAHLITGAEKVIQRKSALIKKEFELLLGSVSTILLTLTKTASVNRITAISAIFHAKYYGARNS